MKNKDFMKRQKTLLRALQLDSNLFLAKMNIATLHQLEGHIDKANKIYSELSKEYPENVEILYRKSGFALQLENFKERGYVTSIGGKFFR